MSAMSPLTGSIKTLLAIMSQSSFARSGIASGSRCKRVYSDPMLPMVRSMPVLPLAGGRFHPDITGEFAAGEILKPGEHVWKRALLQQAVDPVLPRPGMDDPVAVQIALQDFSLCHL